MLLLTILLPLAAGAELFPGQEERREVIVKEISEKTQDVIVDAINNYRRHVVPSARNMLKMTWNEEAAKAAKIRAGTCVGHSSREKKVVSGTYCCESTLNSYHLETWNEIILAWYSNFTDQHYTFGYLFPKRFVSSHSQLLAYNTHQVGCAEAFCPGSSKPFFYICLFCPAIYEPKPGVLPYKIGPLCGDCPDSCLDSLCTNSCNYMDFVPNCHQLKMLFNCNEDIMVEFCPATCHCETEII